MTIYEFELNCDTIRVGHHNTATLCVYSYLHAIKNVNTVALFTYGFCLTGQKKRLVNPPLFQLASAMHHRVLAVNMVSVLERLVLKVMFSCHCCFQCAFPPTSTGRQVCYC